jgi:hypothetical protein
VDFTAVARRVLCGGKWVPVANIGTLITEHFNDPHVVIHGLQGATEVHVVGGRTAQGVPIIGHAGGGDDEIGLLQVVESETSIEDQTSADAAAETRRDLLEAPDYVTGDLLPTAPIAFASLIPGAIADLRVAVIGRQAVGDFRLLSLDTRAGVDSEGRKTETISSVFTTLGTAA